MTSVRATSRSLAALGMTRKKDPSLGSLGMTRRKDPSLGALGEIPLFVIPSETRDLEVGF